MRRGLARGRAFVPRDPDPNIGLPAEEPDDPEPVGLVFKLKSPNPDSRITKLQEQPPPPQVTLQIPSPQRKHPPFCFGDPVPVWHPHWYWCCSSRIWTWTNYSNNHHVNSLHHPQLRIPNSPNRIEGQDVARPRYGDVNNQNCFRLPEYRNLHEKHVVSEADLEAHFLRRKAIGLEAPNSVRSTWDQYHPHFWTSLVDTRMDMMPAHRECDTQGQKRLAFVLVDTVQHFDQVVQSEVRQVCVICFFSSIITIQLKWK